MAAISLGTSRRVVGEVAVHLEHELGALGERPVEPGDVGRPEPFLALAVEDGHPVQLLSEPVGEVAGAVRRAVVDHEDAAAIRQHSASVRTMRSRFSISL